MADFLESYREELAAAEEKATRLWNVYRQAHRDFFDADLKVLYARFNLASAEREQLERDEEREQLRRKAQRNDF